MTPEEPTPTAETEAARPLLARITGALQLQSAVYDEVAADPDATNQAAVVVAIAAVAQALGGPEGSALADIPFILVWAYFSWLVPGTLVWVMGTRVLGLEADLPRVLRCVGFGTTPQLLWIAGLLGRDSEPFLLALATLIFCLGLVANVLGIRQAFQVNTFRAIHTFALGFLAFAGFALVVGFLLAQAGTSLEG